MSISGLTSLIDLTDIFLLQDEIVGRIVNALADVLPAVRLVPMQRATNL